MISRCLIVKDPHATSILDGSKRWEIRGSMTKIRERVGIAKSGTGKIFGLVSVVDSFPISPYDMVTSDNLPESERVMFNAIGQVYKQPHAWVLSNPVLLADPIAFHHPKGAIVWVSVNIEI